MPVIVRVSNKEQAEEKEVWLGEAEKKEIEFYVEFKPEEIEINPDRLVFEAGVINNSREIK